MMARQHPRHCCGQPGIFRAGLRKIFALEDDVRVVGQAETMPQTITAIQNFQPTF